jgi:1,4-dihydroxy-2-naphthoyl-CoA hydrolase
MIDTSASLSQLNATSKDTLISLLGIEYTEVKPEYLAGKMPVDSRTVQPHRSLHGGACSAFAETLASVAATLCIDRKTHFIAALGVDSRFVGMARDGYVHGKATIKFMDEATQVWNVDIKSDKDRLVCTCSVRLAVLHIAQ